MKPKIGILMPVYNNREYVNEAYQSCLAQDYENFKVYITDDGSDIPTYQALKRSSATATLIKTDGERWDINRGTAMAMNNCGRMAYEDGCNYVMVFASDDVMKPNCLSALYEELTSRDLDFVTPWIQLNDYIHQTPEPVSYSQNIQGNALIGFALYKMWDWIEMNGYTQAFSKLCKSSFEDWELGNRMLKAGKKYGVCKQNLIAYRQHEGQFTHKMNRVDGELRSIMRKLHPYD
jgi:GT2 family glycosyltransferase